MVKFGVNQSVERKEDFRLITGTGQYTDDITLDGQLYGYMLRSPVAHARLLSVDVEEARAAPGVVDIILGSELEADNANQLPCMIPLKNRDGSSRADPGHPVLATEKLCYVGDNIAFVIAESLTQAKDAAELIQIDFDELAAVVDTGTAHDGNQAVVHEAAANNVAFDWGQGDEKGVASAFETAAHITEIELINNRVVVNSMEPRGLIADWDAEEGKMTLRMGTQGGWVLRALAQARAPHQMDRGAQRCFHLRYARARPCYPCGHRLRRQSQGRRPEGGDIGQSRRVSVHLRPHDPDHGHGQGHARRL